CRGNPTDPEALKVIMENYRSFSNQLDSDMKKNALMGYHGFHFADLVNAMKMVRQRLIRRISTFDEYVVPCYAAQLGAILYPDGNVAACELRQDILGNLRENGYNFRSIFESDQCLKVRQAISDERCHCTYECFLTNAVMFNPVMFGKVLKETAKIKLNRWFSGGK
ncbi:hypothetical protein K8T06_04355, partial [bacterium]|nr:hypothetical protein [bacterium]